jgi:hypothetical protein
MKCQAMTKSGQPCLCPALVSEDRCLFHSRSAAAIAHRQRGHEPGGFVSRRELLRIVTKDFRDLASKNDAESQRARLRLVPLLSQLINETQQLSKLKKLAKEKGLI